MHLDLVLVSNEYFDIASLPKDKEYLLKYFTNELQMQFLLYYFHIGMELYNRHGHQYLYECFRDHTGHACSEKYLFRALGRYLKLEALVEKYKESGDLDNLSKIRSGDFVLSDL